VESRDAPAPPWGPGFLRLNSPWYRAEYAAATVAILLLVFGWRWLLLHDLPAPQLLLAVFWAIFPDLAAFVPLGLAGRGSRGWPSWGPSLYNVFHSLLVWGAIFAIWSLGTGDVAWPILTWAGHITADRATGFHLRAAGGGTPQSLGTSEPK
jgi:hypothetical protein